MRPPTCPSYPKASATLNSMLLCPPHTHTSPKRTSFSVTDSETSVPCSCVTTMSSPAPMFGSDAGCGGNASVQSPAELHVTTLEALPTVARSVDPGMQLPNNVGASACRTMASENRLCSAKLAAPADGAAWANAGAATSGSSHDRVVTAIPIVPSATEAPPAATDARRAR